MKSGIRPYLRRMSVAFGGSAIGSSQKPRTPLASVGSIVEATSALIQ